jgi:hypothetical protein
MNEGHALAIPVEDAVVSRGAPLGGIERAEVGERTIADVQRRSSGEFVATDIQYLDAPLR